MPTRGPNDRPASTQWPPLPLDAWAETRDTLQLWLQIVGKVRLAHSPLENHWWNVPFYVTARGFTTSLMWGADGRGFQIDFDFVDHELIIETSDEQRRLPLRPQTVATFYAALVRQLDELDIAAHVWRMPVEISGAIPFDEDDVHASYDAEYVERFWRMLVSASHVLHEFRATFVGKASPVHLFWGALDLVVTRYSGRPAPPHTSGAPHCGPRVMLEAYSHEVSSAGYWPGGAAEGVFYSYAYPEPDGFRDAPVRPADAFYDDAFGEFLLPYEAVRTAEDPRAVLLEFLNTTYEAAADRGTWDRAALERVLPEWAPHGVAQSGPLARAAS